MLSFAAITPHPPIIIPTIGSKEDLQGVEKTIESMERLRKLFEKSQTETLIIVSPHAPINFHEITIIVNKNLSGNFSMFGDFKTALEFENDKNLIKKIEASLKKEKLNHRLAETGLDHGTLVPLFYLTKNIKPKIVVISYSLLTPAWNFKYGNALSKTIFENKKKIGIIASGDLSHRLTPEAPAGYSQKGEAFDKKLIQALKNNDIKEILNLDEELAEEAGECGLRSIAILLGVLAKVNIPDLKFNILSYEGPFGVGYLVTNIEGL